MTVATAVTFTFPNQYVGSLTIENGLDQAQWGYNLNTQTYPTYGGEVVQILSVNIGDISMGGSIATYRQAQVIYSYFARYFQVATQGITGTPDPSTYSAYDERYMTFSYPQRGWQFQIQPKTAPGFRWDIETVNPTWQMTAHIVDSNNEGGNLSDIQQAIKNQVVAGLMSSSQNDFFNNTNEQIGPPTGNPNTDPFQTYDEGAENAETALGGLSDYYTSLVSSYQSNNYTAITGNLGSKPATKSSKSSKSKSSKTQTEQGSSNKASNNYHHN